MNSRAKNWRRLIKFLNRRENVSNICIEIKLRWQKRGKLLTLEADIITTVQNTSGQTLQLLNLAKESHVLPPDFLLSVLGKS